MLHHELSKNRNNRDVIARQVAIDGLKLIYASDALRDDHELVMIALSNNGFALRYASDRLRNDRDVVIYAMSNNVLALQYVLCEKLKKDRTFILQAVSRNVECLRYLDPHLCDDKEVIMSAKAEPLSLVWAGIELGNDKVVVMDAVSKNGKNLKYTSYRLRADKEVVLSAVRECGNSFIFASKDLRGDREVAMCAISSGGSADFVMPKISAELKADEEFITFAIDKSWAYFTWTSAKIRDTKRIAINAIEQCSKAFRYVSARLSSDKELILLATCGGEKNVVNITYAHAELSPLGYCAKDVIVCIRLGR